MRNGYFFKAETDVLRQRRQGSLSVRFRQKQENICAAYPQVGARIYRCQ